MVRVALLSHHLKQVVMFGHKGLCPRGKTNKSK